MLCLVSMLYVEVWLEVCTSYIFFEGCNKVKVTGNRLQSVCRGCLKEVTIGEDSGSLHH